MTKKKETSVFQERTADDARFKKAMVEDCLGVIEQVQMHLIAIDHALSFANSHDRGWQQRSGHAGTSELRHVLMHVELEEWRKLLMWGLVVDHKQRERIKVMAKDRFLQRKNSVAEYLNPSHTYPSQYWTADLDHFMMMVDKLFAPVINDDS